MEVGGQTAINSAASGLRRQTFRQTSVSVATIYSSGEWLLMPSQASPCNTAAMYKSLPEENNGAICSALIKDNPPPHTHVAADHLRISQHVERYEAVLNFSLCSSSAVPEEKKTSHQVGFVCNFCIFLCVQKKKSDFFGILVT